VLDSVSSDGMLCGVDRYDVPKRRPYYQTKFRNIREKRRLELHRDDLWVAKQATDSATTCRQLKDTVYIFFFSMVAPCISSNKYFIIQLMHSII